MQYTGLPAWTLDDHDDSDDYIFAALHDKLPVSYSASPGSTAAMSDFGGDVAFSISSSRPFVVDSGASIHISPVRSDFDSFRVIPAHGITGVDGSAIYATGTGDITLPVPGGSNLTLRNTLYVPDTAIRLVSVKSLIRDQPDLQVTFQTDGVQLFSSTTSAFLPTPPDGRLFTLAAPSPRDSANVASRAPTLETLHRRLGHANYRAAYDVGVRMRTEGTSVDLSDPPYKCEPCIRGKQTRTPVPKIRVGERASKPGHCLFIDMWGQTDVVSASGNQFTLDVIDDFSSHNWIFPCRLKSHAARNFRRLVCALRAAGKPVHRVNIDNGGEFLGEEFTAVCSEFDVEVTKTAPYTSAHNGRVERLHRTVCEKSRAMRIAANVPADR